MLIFLTIVSIFLFVILLYFNTGNYKTTIYLGFFFLLLSLYAFIQYILLYSESIFLTGIFFINLSFQSYLIGPVFYWYVRSVLTDNSRLKKKDLLHFLPALIFLLAAIPYILTPWSEKVDVANQLIKDTDLITTYQATILHDLFSPAAVFMSRPVLVLGYALWSAGLLIRYHVKKKESLVLSNQRFMTKWLFSLVGLLILLSASHFLLMFETFSLRDFQIFKALNILQLLSLSGFIGMLILPFFYPAILYGLPQLPGSALKLKPGESMNVQSHTEITKSKHIFESDYLVSIGKKADFCMKELQPFLQPGFNLQDLSDMIHIPVHHLAYYFRDKKESFTDYRNAWRVAHAKKLIRDGKAKIATLETIGLLSGFANRNTFLTAFKKNEGTSPHSFAAGIKKQIADSD